jgi:hypothetical protein
VSPLPVLALALEWAALFVTESCGGNVNGDFRFDFLELASSFALGDVVAKAAEGEAEADRFAREKLPPLMLRA